MIVKFNFGKKFADWIIWSFKPGNFWKCLIITILFLLTFYFCFDVLSIHHEINFNFIIKKLFRG